MSVVAPYTLSAVLFARFQCLRAVLSIVNVTPSVDKVAALFVDDDTDALVCRIRATLPEYGPGMR